MGHGRRWYGTKGGGQAQFRQPRGLERRVAAAESLLLDLASGPTCDGYKYKDEGASEDGIGKVLVKGSTENNSKALVKGKGAALPDPTLGNLPLPIVAQLRNQQTGVCMEGIYDSADVIKNDTQHFPRRLAHLGIARDAVALFRTPRRPHNT